MTEKERFMYGSNERWECVLIDTLEKKEYDFYEVRELCSRLWKQTQRFEKHNKDLTEENKELKQITRNLGDFRNFITERNVSNEKQRKELQLQMLRLYNYFENWFEDTMSPNAFSEMWDNVKEDRNWEKK